MYILQIFDINLVKVCEYESRENIQSMLVHLSK